MTDNTRQRLKELTTLFRQHIQDGLTTSEIADHLDVTRQTALKDIDRLTLDGIPIYQEGHRYFLDPTFRHQITLSLAQAWMLYLPLRRMVRARLQRIPLVRGLLRAVTTLLRDEIADELAADESEVDDQADQIFKELVSCWQDNCYAQVVYLALNSNRPTTLTVAPWWFEPAVWTDAFYLVCGRPLKNGQHDTMTLKLERIQSVRCLPEHFERPPGSEITALVQQTWGIWLGNNSETVRVRLRFNNHLLQRLRETAWHPTQQIRVGEDGAVLWEADIAEPREMIPWIRGWGADVEVLEPEGLRKALMREARELARLYDIALPENSDKQYFAHSKEGLDESEWQPLRDHLIATGNLAFKLGQNAGVSELAQTAGLLHDIGKYSHAFQNRLHGSRQRADHATAGAREIVRLFPDRPQKDFAELLSYCIAGHHSGLPDYGSMADVGTEGTLLARREKKKLEDYSAYKNELDTGLLNINHPVIKPARFRFGELEHPFYGFSTSFLTRMIFSTLVDADWLETENYMHAGEKSRGQYASIDALCQQFNHFLLRFENPKIEINRKRTETLKACIANAEQKPGFFTLTVPTGGGKTLASMAFALNHAVEHGLERVIYVIPFTSIIEQNANEFKKAFGALGQENVLEHHSNFDWEQFRQASDNETNKVSEKLKLAAENWDIPIVVTTNVQFFESLFASKKSQARKLHNIAKCVIIFDEVQMLPREYLKPCLLAISELVQNYSVSAVFCTATQPSLQDFFPSETMFTELAPDPQALYGFYRRVQVKNLGALPDENLKEQLNAHKQVLCIVNTRRHAKGLFDNLIEDGSFHLSTLMCPAHRKTILKEIRNLLKSGQDCRVVSTQVMEAGIDIDFPVGFRALAGLDSIIQAAGRVNREGSQPSSEMFVFDPKTEFIKRTPTFIMQTASVAKAILRNHSADPTSIAAINAYYKMLYTLQDERNFDTSQILGYFDKGTNALDFDFKTAAENFKLINDNTVTVIIPYNAEAIQLLEELKFTPYPRSTMRKLQLYTVNIYEREFHALQSKGVIQTIADTYHVLDEDKMKAYYHPKTGLVLPERVGGEAIFFD